MITMIKNPIDINYIFNERDIKLLKELGWYGSIFIQNHEEYDKKKLEEVKEYGKIYDLNIYSAIKIQSKSSKELLKYVKKYRDKIDIIMVEGGILKINRQALELHNVDILSTPELNRQDNGLDHILARLGSTHRVAIELNFKELLKKKHYERAKILWAFRRNILLAKKYDTPIVISSGAMDRYDIKSPNDLRSFLNTLTEDANYSKHIMETTYKIVEYRTHLKKNNVIRYGLEIID